MWGIGVGARIPSRYGLRIPDALKQELSETSQAGKCFIGMNFCRSLQEYLVDYSLTVGSSPVLQTDLPNTAFYKNTDYLDETISIDTRTEAVKQAEQEFLKKEGIISSEPTASTGTAPQDNVPSRNQSI